MKEKKESSLNNRENMNQRMKTYDTVNLLSKIEQTKQMFPSNKALNNIVPKERLFLDWQSCLAKNANHFIFEKINEKQKYGEDINIANIK